MKIRFEIYRKGEIKPFIAIDANTVEQKTIACKCIISLAESDNTYRIRKIIDMNFEEYKQVELR